MILMLEFIELPGDIRSIMFHHGKHWSILFHQEPSQLAGIKKQDILAAFCTPETFACIKNTQGLQSYLC